MFQPLLIDLIDIDGGTYPYTNNRTFDGGTYPFTNDRTIDAGIL